MRALVPSVSKLSLTFLHSRNLDSYDAFAAASSVGCENFTVAPVLQRRLFRGILKFSNFTARDTYISVIVIECQ